ncbi:MAG: DNA repair protein RecN [Synergistetes bacterium]|nr:DNA repair protein RecN [Synergistota bacterium]
MIRELRIKDFAIIDELEIEFHPHLTVLTGETGAGKSIIVGALSLLLGKRVGGEVVRSGAKKAEIEALFEDESGEEIILRREVYSEGRSRAFYQGRGVPVGFLREKASSLFEIHSQLEHGWILKESNQLSSLDKFGGEAFMETLKRYEELYSAYLAKKRELEEILYNLGELRRKREEISFFLSEIDSASLKEGEEEKLIARRERLLNLEELASSLREALSLLEGGEWGGGIIERIGELKRLLSKIAHYENEMLPFLKEMESFLSFLMELESAVSRKLDYLGLEEGNLNEVEERLSLIRRLKKKHGVDNISDLLKLASAWKEELSELREVEERTQEIEEEVNLLFRGLRELAREISYERKKLAKLLESEVKDVLRKLAMGEILFKIDIKQGELGPRGIDVVRFLMAPASGEKLKSIGEIASGGEISRLSFALKCVISRNYGIPTLIFDEIDVGIGGEVGKMLAEEIKKLSSGRQVICITHLASIASKADYHYFVDKVVDEGSVKSRVRLLTGEERIRELARMLSGRASDAALRHARELLEGG